MENEKSKSFVMKPINDDVLKDEISVPADPLAGHEEIPVPDAVLNKAQMKQVDTFVKNCFIKWHKPTNDRSLQNAGILDAIFLYADRIGFDVKVAAQEIKNAAGEVIGTTEPFITKCHFNADEICAWAMEQKRKQMSDRERKAAEAAAQAGAPAPPELPPIEN